MTVRRRLGVAVRLISLVFFVTLALKFLGFHQNRNHLSESEARNSNLSPSENPDLFNQQYKQKESEIQERFRDRRDHLNDVCDQHFAPDYSLNWKTFAEHRQRESQKIQWWERLFVVPKARIVFCSIPQVDSVDWVRHLTLLGKYIDRDTAELKEDWLNISSNYIVPLSRYRPEEAKSMLRDWTRVIWVRDPLERLVLGWEDKVHSSERFSPERDLVLRKIMPSNGTKGQQLLPILKPISLETFFNYLANQPSTFGFDINWRPYRDLCAVCQMPYDFILHRETEKNFAELPFEVGHVFKQSLKRDDLPIFKPSQPVDDESEPQLNQLPRALLHRVLDIYKMDYALFDFERPNIVT